MRTDDLDYDLPPALIAQTPAEPRDSARLLVYDRASEAIRHRHFRDLLDELRPDDLVVLNDGVEIERVLVGGEVRVAV